MTIHIVRPGQSLMDIACVRYGDVSGINWLLEDNPALAGPTERLYENQQLMIRDEVINPRVRSYLEGYATIATIKREDMPEGVGFWSIEEYSVG